MAESEENLDIDVVLRQLNTSRTGITDDEALTRLRQYGYNSVERQKESRIKKFLGKFWSPVPWMLELTAAISFILNKSVDTSIILLLLVFNGFVSYFQESKADNALELLEGKMSPSARVLRNSTWKQISSKELVPGDVIHCRMGDLVPADMKIISGEVMVDQSALTGESNPVRKAGGDLLYSGSMLRKGETTGVVTGTGINTLFGKTAELVKGAKSESHLEKLILSIVKYLVAIDVALVLSLFLFSFLYKTGIYDTIPYSLVVLIASVPVALPATFTISTAYGALDLSRKGALVTRLTAIEDAASMDAICFDKTGTLTENRLSVSDPIAHGCTVEELTTLAVLASDVSSQDSIDLAILDYAKKRRIVMEGYVTREFVPFDPATKRTEAVIEKDNVTFRVLKGAPQVLLELCNASDREAVMSTVVEFAGRGYRTIGVVRSLSVGINEFCGLMPMHDPPRKDSAELVDRIKELGIRPRMITGDSTPIALEMAKEVTIGDRICKTPASTVNNWNVSDCDAFAEVLPEDKFQLVKSLQADGHITGMTGDGVNDAPALKQAEVGIAVATATDVAKASASIVLTHEGIIDIISAIEDGRKIFQRMLTYTLNKIIKTVQVAVFLTVSFFIYGFFVTTPFDVILLLFANDFATMAIATDNVRFSKNPEKWNVRSLVGSSVSLSAFIIIESFFVLWTALKLGLSVNQIHTFIFDMLVFSGQFTVYMVRERGRFWSSRPSKWLLVASVCDIIFIASISGLGILVTQIPIIYVLLVLGITFVSMALVDLFKNVVFRHYNI